MLITKCKVLLLLCLLAISPLAIARPTISFGQEFANTWRNVTFETINNSIQQRRFANMIQRELAKYPDAYFAAINLQTILLVRNLQVDGLDFGGWAFSAFNVVIVNTGRTQRGRDGTVQHVNYSDTFIRRMIHHELHHRAEFSVLPNVRNWMPWQPLYTGLYISSQEAVRQNLTGEYDRDLLGFLTSYSTSHPREDRATMTEFFMASNRTRRQFINKAMRDELFYQKALVLLTMLAEQLHFSEPLEVFLQRTARR